MAERVLEPLESVGDATETSAFETLQLHAGQRPDPATGARAVPIYATSSYAFESAEHAAGVFAGEAGGNQYGRTHNPTTAAFAARLAALEGGQRAVALSSGQAATTSVLFALARPGANVVASRELFGGTFQVARKLLEPWGCGFRAVAPTPEAVAAALDGDTACVWLETIANPSGTVPDLPAVAAVAHAVGVPLVVDNTWGCGGYLCRPLEHGADAVIHSATKWIGGHGTFIGGAVVDAGRFDYGNGRFPAFTQRDARGKTYLDKGGLAARVEDLGLSTMGMTLSPFAAFLGLQGLETLSLRVQRACDSAQALAAWLEALAQVRRVVYPGLPSHPSHATAQRVLRRGFGAVLAFEAASEARARSFLDRVRLASHLANIGDAKTVVIHPWTTTHAALSPEERRAAGVTPELVRVSVGLEDVGDLQRDFAQALAIGS